MNFNNDHNDNPMGIRMSNYSVSNVKIEKPKQKIFTKVASKKSLKKLIGNNAENIFDFYAFNSMSKYQKYISFKSTSLEKEIHESLIQFFNGLTLLILERILSKGGKNKNCEIYLKKLLKKVKDKFALSLISNQLYNDLGEYLSEYLFNREGYKILTLEYINEIIKSKYELAMLESGRSKEDQQNFNRMEDILRMVQEKSGIEYMLTFAFVQILEEFGINMSICASDLTKNRPIKRKLYDSFALTQESVDFVLVMLKLPKGINFSFGNRFSEEEQSINYEQALGFGESLEIQNQPPPSFGGHGAEGLFMKNRFAKVKNNANNDVRSLKSDHQTLLNYNNQDDFLKSLPLADGSVSDFSMSDISKKTGGQYHEKQQVQGYQQTPDRRYYQEKREELYQKTPDQRYFDTPVLEQESRSSNADYGGTFGVPQNQDFMVKKGNPEILDIPKYRGFEAETGNFMEVDNEPNVVRVNKMKYVEEGEDATTIPSKEKTVRNPFDDSIDSYNFTEPSLIPNQKLSTGLNSLAEDAPIHLPQDEMKTNPNHKLREELEKKQEYADKMIQETNEAINRILGKMKEKKEKDRKRRKSRLTEANPEIRREIENLPPTSQKRNKTPERAQNQNFNRNFNENKSNPVTDRNLFKILNFMNLNTIGIKSTARRNPALNLKKEESYIMSPSNSKYKLLITSPHRSPEKKIGKWEKLKSKNVTQTPQPESRYDYQQLENQNEISTISGPSQNYWSLPTRDREYRPGNPIRMYGGGRTHSPSYQAFSRKPSNRDDLSGINGASFRRRPRVSVNNYQGRPSMNTFGHTSSRGISRGHRRAGNSPHSKYLRNLNGGSLRGVRQPGFVNYNNNLNLWG